MSARYDVTQNAGQGHADPKRNEYLGWCVLAATGYTTVAIVALHVLRPDLPPYRHAISEYAIGSYGLLMTTAFFAQSLGSLALAASVTRGGPGQRRAWIGSALFIVAAAGAAVAGLFPADVGSPYPQTRTGAIHAAAGLVRFLSLSLALPLLSSALGTHPQWRGITRTLKLLAALFGVTFVLSVFVLANLDLFGLGQRAFVATLLAWMSFVVYPMIRARGQKGKGSAGELAGNHNG